MTITKNFARQELLVAYVDINLADVVTAVDKAAIAVPPNSVIISGQVTTTEAWNSTSTDVLDVGDATSQNRYLNDGNIRALAALVPLVPTGFITTAAEPNVTVRWTSGGGTPTTGKARVAIQYYCLGRGETTYGS